MRFTLTERIAAPVADVFALFTDLPNAAGRVQSIRHIELLTSGPVGAGTRFRETRIMLGTEQTEEMEIVAFDPPHNYTLQCISCGTEYRSQFRFLPCERGTQLEQEFTTRPLTLVAKLLSPLSTIMFSPVKQSLHHDLRDLKQIAERHARPR